MIFAASRREGREESEWVVCVLDVLWRKGKVGGKREGYREEERGGRVVEGEREGKREGKGSGDRRGKVEGDLLQN
eukprot:432145-Amorphochlora_amoeboformis.AAC.1